MKAWIMKFQTEKEMLQEDPNLYIEKMCRGCAVRNDEKMRIEIWCNFAISGWIDYAFLGEEDPAGQFELFLRSKIRFDMSDRKPIRA